MLDGMYVTKSISTGLYPNLDLWTANKLQLQLQSKNICKVDRTSVVYGLIMGNFSNQNM